MCMELSVKSHTDIKEKEKKRICIGYRYADASNNLYIKYADNKGEHSQCKELKEKEAV